MNQHPKSGRIVANKRRTHSVTRILAAEADIAEAAQWYDDRQPGLGEAFID